MLENDIEKKLSRTQMKRFVNNLIALIAAIMGINEMLSLELPELENTEASLPYLFVFEQDPSNSLYVLILIVLASNLLSLRLTKEINALNSQLKSIGLEKA